jgi:endoglucanase
VPLTPTKPVLSAGDVLSWTAAKDIGTPVRFTVSLDGAAGTGTEGTSLPVTTPAGHHTWTITARDAAGNEARPATLSVWRDATPPTTPTITTPTTLSWVGVRSVAVAWAAATDADSGIAGYQLTINGVPAKTLLPATTLRTTVSLVEGINSIGVAAVNLAGVAGESGQISVGSDISAPTRPAITAPGAASTVGTSVTLTWTAAADPGSGVTGYLVSLNGRLVATLTAATLSYQVSGVSAKANTLSVVAVNAAGGKSAASTVAVTH